MANRLAGATSPYLRQHAGNPVDWYPWGDEAFARARREDKPVLLSVGYSACHWCHVMAHESFEDDEVAAVMNREFVNVKVDREERPDVDQIYQTAHALMARRSGGWPLTVFLTPDGDPFFAGTYFPKRGRHGLPGFVDLLPKIASAWREKREAIAAQSEELRLALRSLEPRPGLPEALPADAPARLLRDLAETFDAQDGGFGGAPKFPHVPDLAFALAQGVQGAPDGLAIATVTGRRMAEGGIHDQLGGGFCRYSVDAGWQVPHFEKMLYDNGPLLGLYADLARAGPQATLFEDAAEGIVEWLQREMRAGDGAFFSSLDADSEGEEGRFYLWQAGEVRALLTDDEYAVAAPHFGLDRAPNFEGHAWNLVAAKPVEAIAARLRLDVGDAERLLAAASAKLFDARSRRVRPGLDDKILTSWNALAIAGLARASRRLAWPDAADLAFSALDAQKRCAWRDGRLLATRHGDRAQLNGYLDDYAFTLVALDEAMRTRFRLEDYAFARELADALLARFEDGADGGFWFTSHDHETLIHRTKPGHDNATPSGNGMAALGLIALGHLAGEPRYVAAAERAVRLFAPRIAQSPRGYATLVGALEALERPPATVLLVGDPHQTSAWHAALEQALRPGVHAYDCGGQALPPELRKGPLIDAGAAAWVCEAAACLPPIDSLPALLRVLDARSHV
ncbi:MAG TPA: thioredoxin domain-containing protein [Casimicrobiaceae bacterium]|nr:thioredoxin domain-containing protein [Casimicrobiaceae bacterium]